MPQPRTIVIGDIHGCSAALAEILEQIDPQAEDTLITLGDYVNRGPNSRGVLDQLIKLSAQCQLVPLLGNHDEVLLETIDGQADVEMLERMGGQATLDSYGLGTTVAELPGEHIGFLRSCRSYYETATHLFAHANYDPGRPLAGTDGYTLIWRKLEPPYPAPHYSGKPVIVGHTAQHDFEILDLGHVVCIDTGCVHGGVLTALEVLTGDHWQVRGNWLEPA